MNTIINKINKQAIWIAMCAFSFLFFTGCEDFLDKQPLGRLSESVFTNKETIDKLVISCYSPLNGYMNGITAWVAGPDNNYIAEMGAGNMHKGSTTGDQPLMLDMERFQINADNGRTNQKWILCYGAIERCNDVLRTVRDNEISDLLESDKNQVIAEIRFLRAYYYFELRKIYLNVPYIDENVTDPQRRVKNDHDIYPEIEADFLHAIANLPETQSEPGRPTKSAAKSFLAKTYLYQQKFSQAKQLFDEVIESGRYQLLPNYFDCFNAEKNNSSESIWANQVAVNVAGASYNRSQRFSDLAYPNQDDFPQLTGAGFNQPSFDLVNAYKTGEDGLPLFGTYYLTDFKHDQGIESNQEFEPDMTTPVDPRLDWVVGRRGVPYHDWSIHPGKRWIRDQPTAGPYNQKKWVILKSQVEKYGHDNQAKFNAMCFPIIRYAQVLLFAAECEIEIGNPEKAREYINMIRARARDGYVVRLGADMPFGDGPPAANYKIDIYKESWAGQTKEWMRDRVRFETRLEMALEGHWHFDLVRWGIAESFINAYIGRESKIIQYLNGVSFGVNNSYFPIPLAQIDRSYLDGQPTLTQNPGY